MATTTLKTSSLPREFVFNGSRIPDPDPQMSIDQVPDLLTPSYPEIATARMTGPEDTGTSLRYTFSRAIREPAGAPPAPTEKDRTCRPAATPVPS
jgi:PRTRC genetic system protein C